MGSNSLSELRALIEQAMGAEGTGAPAAGGDSLPPAGVAAPKGNSDIGATPMDPTLYARYRRNCEAMGEEPRLKTMEEWIAAGRPPMD